MASPNDVPPSSLTNRHGRRQSAAPPVNPADFRRLSQAHERRSSLAHDRRGSSTYDRRGSLAYDRRGSSAYDRRGSLAYDRRGSLAYDRRGSLACDRRGSLAYDKRGSVAYNRRTSIATHGTHRESTLPGLPAFGDYGSGFSPKEKIKIVQPKPKNKQELLANANEFHRILFQYVDSRIFSGFILFVILLNTGILVAQTWQVVTVRAGWYFSAIDNVFLGIYIMEVVLKIFVWRHLFFKEGWNILDMLIVLFNVVDFLLPLVMQNVAGFNGAAIFRLLRIFRAIRAIRALRVLRTIRFLSNLQVIMATCLQSVQSMGAIVMLTSLFIYMFAVIGRGLYAEVDKDRFGNTFAAGFTLFQLLTLDDWFYIYSDIIGRDSGKWHVLFYLLLYIVVEYLIFLNLFVAVLVDNFQLTLEAANEANKKKKKHEEETNEDEDDIILAKSMTSESISTHLSEISERPPRKVIDDYYSSMPSTDQVDLERYFQLLVGLEYNMHALQRQTKTVDMLVDMCVETNDDV